MSDLYNYKAMFVRAVDGDTIEVEIDLGFDIHHVISVRLAGVNTPERGQSGYNEAKAFTHNALAKADKDFNLKLKTVKVKEKYGRYLAFIDATDIGGPENLSESIIKEKLGVPYFGGAR